MRSKLLLLLQICFVTVVFSCSSQNDPFQEIVQTQMQRYPEMQIEDIYKLTHQAAMGNIHLGIEPQILRNYLYSEWDKMNASDDEPLVEEISPDLIRLNLRPFKARGGDPERLFEAMMLTAKSFRPDKEKIGQYWNVIEEMAEERLLPFPKGEFNSFFDKMRSADFPAVHHSEEYSKSYNPAYRVILKRYLPESK
jgi:hypothetical protein